MTKEKFSVEFDKIENKNQFYDAVSICCKLINQGVLMSKEDIDAILKNMAAIRDFKESL